MSILTKDIDKNPYTGERKVTGKLRLSTAGYLDPYFNNDPDYFQVKGVTRGKIYDVVKVEGFGDAEDVTVIDDNGYEYSLADFFFEEVDEV